MSFDLQITKPICACQVWMCNKPFSQKQMRHLRFPSWSVVLSSLKLREQKYERWCTWSSAAPSLMSLVFVHMELEEWIRISGWAFPVIPSSVWAASIRCRLVTGESVCSYTPGDAVKCWFYQGGRGGGGGRQQERLEEEEGIGREGSV